MEPLVSVIIPTYNRAKLVELAIKSALEQTQSNYEIIIVDDGSTDNTKNKIEKLSSENDSIRYYYQTNKGRSSARNFGIRVSKGEYIAFLDSDDLFFTEKLKLQVEFLEKHPDIGLAYSGVLCVSDKGVEVRENFLRGKRLEGWIYPDILFIKGSVIKTPTVIVRSSILREVGGFDEQMSICEDLDLWRRISKNYKVGYIDKRLAEVHYRNRDISSIEQNLDGRKKFLEKAFAEDPNLENSIYIKLCAEMYSFYGMEAIFSGNIRLGIELLNNAITLNSLQTIPYLIRYLFLSFLSLISTILSKILPLAIYKRIKSIFYKIDDSIRNLKKRMSQLFQLPWTGKRL